MASGRQKSGFTVGDVVELLSGGPHMTITGIIELNECLISCLWFVDDKLQSGSFPSYVLKICHGNAKQGEA
jgi:uncharacterized protein YodC (DUF2158 family)